MAFKFAESGLIALKELLYGLDEPDVPLLEILRYQVGSLAGTLPSEFVAKLGLEPRSPASQSRALPLPCHGPASGALLWGPRQLHLYPAHLRHSLPTPQWSGDD